MDFGSSVAEFDKNLEHYFVDTDDFRTLISGKKEIISGDKGTGKTALFKIFSQRYRSVPERNDTEIIPAFNPTGNPVFQRLAQLTTLTEGQYRAVWKSYILSLVGNWLLDVFEPGAAHELESLDALLPIFERDQVAIVMDGKEFLGLITRIDLINYLRRTA